MEERADILPIANIGQVCIINVITLTVELFDVTLHFPRNARVVHWISFSNLLLKFLLLNFLVFRNYFGHLINKYSSFEFSTSLGKITETDVKQFIGQNPLPLSFYVVGETL